MSRLPPLDADIDAPALLLACPALASSAAAGCPLSSAKTTAISAPCHRGC